MVAPHRVLLLACLLLGTLAVVPASVPLGSAAPSGLARADESCVVVDPTTGQVTVYPGACTNQGP
jgi:hypothetical protein